MTHAARRLLPIAFALLALAATAPGTAAAGPSTAAFPNQSLGNRGADVRAIQGLLRAHGSTIAVDGDLRRHHPRRASRRSRRRRA